MIVSLDFETRSRAELTNVGAKRYAMDPSTDVLCTAYAIDDSDPCVFRGHAGAFAENLKTLADQADVIFCAFNVGFEFNIWHEILVPRHGYPPIPLHRWRCSAASALMHSLPRKMGDVAKALNLPVLKDEDGKRVMMKMCKPVSERSRDKYGEWHEEEEDFEILMRYCQDDVRVEREIVKRLGFLPDAEQKIWELDQRINNNGLRMDVELAEGLLKAKDAVCADLSAKCKAEYGFSPSQVGKIKDELKANGVEIPLVRRFKKNKETGKKEAQMTESLGSQQIKKLIISDVPSRVKRLLKLRKEFATTSLAKADAGLKCHDNGTLYGQFMYHGANTGRWSGRHVQLHNLPRGSFSEDWVDDELEAAVELIKRPDVTASMLEASFDGMSAMEIMKSSLRGLIIPREGNKLAVLDFAQIEGRVLAWLAGQQDVLDAFASGVDMYKFVASQIYQCGIDDVTKDQRFIGKVAMLALGYQGGAGAFISMATNFGVLVEESFANEIKNDWRERNSHIVQFWYDLERAAIRAVTAGTTTKAGCIMFKVRNDFLECRLPSGRKLFYYKPTIQSKVVNGKPRRSLRFMGSDQQRGIQWGLIDTYGGKLAENVTQAVSRDLLANSMLNLDAAGYSIIGHVHDEILTEGPDVNIKDMERVMLKAPDWAEGIPLGVDGFVGTRYRK